ncbi:MAG: AAA family ATPase, partial [Bacteroidetes bacterium]|nr:AAA family ATPase [Bacteroidota bacterium]
MIHKVEYIRSVGKFRDFQASGDIAFRKITMIYADNGTGKTTISAIFRSLSENNTRIIEKRLSTNPVHNTQSIQIVESDNSTPPNRIHHTYGTHGWSNPLTDIEVFDIHFVNNNIYSGFVIDTAHQQNLHQFVMGANGVALAQQIEQNKVNKSTCRTEIERLRTLLFRTVGFGLNEQEIGSFMSLTPVEFENIEDRINASQTEFTQAQSADAIRALPVLNILPLNVLPSPFDFQTILHDLLLNLQQLQNSVLQEIFETHCADLNSSNILNPELWLRTGYNFVLSKQSLLPENEHINCPFCASPIDSSNNLFLSYTQRFNEEFNSLVNRLESNIRLIQDYNQEAYATVITINGFNTEIISNWRTYLTEVAIPNFEPILELCRNLRPKLSAFLNCLNQKLQNPSISVDTAPVNEFQSFLNDINSQVTEYNTLINQFNTEINLFRSRLPAVNVAQSELNRLSRIRARFDPHIIEICENLNQQLGRLRELDAEYTVLTNRQETESNIFFTQYASSVNEYLSNVFNTSFLISNVENVRPQGRAVQSRIRYDLTFDGQQLSFNPDDVLNTKDGLSEGDKSTLAFAFFMAKIVNDPNRANKIVVLDDPLSSFDTHRRNRTVTEIIRLSNVVKQVIVLSHDKKFLYDINKRIRVSQKKGLLVSYSGNSSVIVEANIEKLIENHYYKAVENIRTFVSNPTEISKDLVRSDIRIVLESCLIFKFYN